MIQITHNFVICEVVSILFFFSFFFCNLDISKIESKPKVTTDFRVKLTRHLLSQWQWQTDRIIKIIFVSANGSLAIDFRKRLQVLLFSTFR